MGPVSNVKLKNRVKYQNKKIKCQNFSFSNVSANFSVSQFQKLSDSVKSQNFKNSQMLKQKRANDAKWVY